ncbi:MAG: LarC family nickel insertion protein, partial [Gemmatimonadales bacterium]|nr:LarC family nickel insertion protein [Gemmatimonadales bacterium]
AEPNGHATTHGAVHTHAHHGPHRHIGQLIRAVEAADLSEWVRTRAVQAFRLLGEAEGRVHGVPAEDVSLHEVGAVDALVDIVGGIEGFEVLGLRTVYNRPVAVGSGWVRAAHGVMAVPAPATGLLLEGLQIGPDGPVTGEATTPTGAVLLRVLTSGPPPDGWRPVRSSWGAGGRNPVEYANALRMIVAERASEAGEVVLMATDLDDLSPEYLEPLRSAMFDAGALDVQIWATQMKKGRTGFRVEATMAPGDADRVAGAVLRHSTSAGLRRWRAERTTLQRETIEVEAGDGSTVRVKLVRGPDGVRAKPEFDDVVEVARRTGRAAHEVASELHLQALRQADARLAGGPETPNTSHKE